MKKFTFLLAFLVIALMANSQISKSLQNKIEKANENYLKFSEMVKYAEKQTSGKSALLKSANAALKLDSVVSWSLEIGTDKWNYDYKDEYYFNKELKNTSILNKEWDLFSNSWSFEGKTELEYNQDLVKSMLIYNKDEESGALVQSSKFMFFYNPGGLQDSALIYNIETEGDPFVLNMKQYRFYNDAKQLIKTDIWATDEAEAGFILSLRVVITYYGSGKIKTSTTNMFLDGEEIPFNKTEYYYDGSGNLTSKVNSTLDFMNGGMVNEDRYTYEYNGFGKVKIETYSKWNEGAWADENKTESEFNSAGDISVEISYEKDGANWNVVDKYEYEYGSINFSDIIYPAFFTSFDLVILEGMEENDVLNFDKQVTGMKYYEMLNGALKYTGKTTLFYSSGTSTNISETDNSIFTAYPNPASESVSFNWKGNIGELTLKIYQITGAQVMEQTTTSGSPVSISKLGNGVYFFKLLNSGQTVHSGKLIKN